MFVPLLRPTTLFSGEVFSRPPPATLPSNKNRGTASTVTKMHTLVNNVGTHLITRAAVFEP